MTYTVSPIQTHKKEGCWDTHTMGIFEQEGDYYRYLGSYHRVYDGFLSETFCPFQHANGQWYALFSGRYDKTSLMHLPDCKVLGDETVIKTDKGYPINFCPTGFYVPKYRIYYHSDRDLEFDSYPTADPIEFASLDKEYDSYTEGYLPIGFVSGCVWGDDSSWKVDMFDLRDAPNGIITRSKPFGYCELPNMSKIEDCIRITSYEPFDRDPYMHIEVTCATTKAFSLNDLKPWNE